MRNFHNRSEPNVFFYGGRPNNMIRIIEKNTMVFLNKKSMVISSFYPLTSIKTIPQLPEPSSCVSGFLFFRYDETQIHNAVNKDFSHARTYSQSCMTINRPHA
jgi:hypothetical protein